MDMSKKYVKMSKEAKRGLSNYFKGKPGDLYVGLNGKIHMVDSNIITDGTLHPDCTPLFRQDQLQEMVINKECPIWALQSVFNAWGGGTVPHQKLINGLFFPSMEQLWLAFVMKEKYNKVWNGKDWIRCQVAQQEG